MPLLIVILLYIDLRHLSLFFALYSQKGKSLPSPPAAGAPSKAGALTTAC